MKGEQHQSNTQLKFYRTHHRQTPHYPRVGPGDVSAQKSLVDAGRFSSLHKPVSIVAWVLRTAKIWLEINQKSREQGKVNTPRHQGQEHTLNTHERVHPSNPYEFTTVNLFGPYAIKDAVKMIKWGIVFCCMALRVVQTDIYCQQPVIRRVSPGLSEILIPQRASKENVV